MQFDKNFENCVSGSNFGRGLLEDVTDWKSRFRRASAPTPRPGP